VSCRFCDLDRLQSLCGEADIVGRISIWLKHRETGDGSIRDVTFDTVLCADFYVVLKTLDDLDTLAAYQLGVHVEAVQRIVNPHLIAARVALQCCGTGRSRTSKKREADSENKNK